MVLSANSRYLAAIATAASLILSTNLGGLRVEGKLDNRITTNISRHKHDSNPASSSRLRFASGNKNSACCFVSTQPALHRRKRTHSHEQYKMSSTSNLNIVPLSELSLSESTSSLQIFNEEARKNKRRIQLLRSRRIPKRKRQQLRKREFSDRSCYATCTDDITDTEITTKENNRSFRIPKPASCNKEHRSEAQRCAATDVSTLRRIFGTNKNKFWGDLDTETTRMLYHTLLPRALLSLHSQGLDPHELAPLAYEARVAAKEYARERCHIPGRLMAVAYDGFRHLKTYGKWSTKGLSWDQIWNKYERQIRKEIQRRDPSLKTEDLTSQVCLRILERSCTTNELVDRLVMGESDDKGKKRSSEAEEVLAIAAQLDREVHEMLNRNSRMNVAIA